ncbi:DUF2975 domain-containing protein [Phytomonospora sp. NPDC050363]|uniref:DUF2975 domain-containing protein n=1 Tax=Phytomonospora sp. NPDC050363 TaxID=3155642 RepID=UPI0033F443B8
MSADTAARVDAGPLPSPDWLRRLQRGLTVLSVLGALAVVLTATASVYARLSDDDNPLGYITGRVEGDEAGLGYEFPADGGPVREVRLGNPEGVRMQIFDVLTWLPSLALATVLLFLLRDIVRHARRTDPFHSDTARRLRRAGWIAAVGGFLAGSVERAGHGLALLASPTQNVTADDEMWVWAPYSLRDLVFGLPWVWFAVGVALLAIASVFSRGIAMRRDLDGLV